MASGDHDFHQEISSVGRAAGVAASPAGSRWLRTDWCARATRISIVAPTTAAKTPRSKTNALGHVHFAQHRKMPVRGVAG